MKTYIVKELQNANSERKGKEVRASSLASAKRIASKMQCFYGTVLRIESESGDLLAQKINNSWS